MTQRSIGRVRKKNCVRKVAFQDEMLNAVKSVNNISSSLGREKARNKSKHNANCLKHCFVQGRIIL